MDLDSVAFDPLRAGLAQAFCQDFEAAPPSQRAVLGINVYTHALMNAYSIGVVIDDERAGHSVQGVPIIPLEAVRAETLVVSAAGGRPFTAGEKLEQHGLRFLDYFAFRQFASADLPQVIFNEGFRKDFLSHSTEYSWLFDVVEDNESRKVLESLIRFRLSLDLSNLEGFTSREEEQYFEDFLGLRPSGEHFLDVGGFDGMSAIHFARLCPDYTRISVVEPDPINADLCRLNLADLPNVQVIEAGLGHQAGTAFLTPAGSTSTISESSGEKVVPVLTLDDLVNQIGYPTYIKFDIEGGERNALAGASTLIREACPLVAVAVYHQPGDFWRIPRLLLSLQPAYRVFVRHYTESIYETIMYFVYRK